MPQANTSGRIKTLLSVQDLTQNTKATEREGFEPPELALSGFQDRPLRPLGHLSDADQFGLTPNGIESRASRQLLIRSLRLLRRHQSRRRRPRRPLRRHLQSAPTQPRVGHRTR